MSAALYDTLRTITTATITTILLKKGIRRCWMNGPRPLVSGGARTVGPAFTLRFVPVREDLATPESWAKPISTRGAIEEMPADCIAVADAMGVTSAGIFGDILTLRMLKRNVAALVTDGVVRDKEGVLASKLPVWCAGTAAPASVNGLTFVGWQEPIACGGCAIFPGDVIVCDDDGGRGDPEGSSRLRRRGGRRARAHGELYRLGGRARGETPRPLSHERGDQGALRGVEEEVIRSLRARAIVHQHKSPDCRHWM
jgi:regulator of RNase E activity RraA